MENERSPKEPSNALYKEMKESKKTLRQKQQQAAARIRENKYNDIMESADFNQQLFYKLIREQRTTRSDETDTIIIDDMVLNEDECILND
jgi:regulator of protease activity HflC (stomatin/prohibitin superfamily)